MGVGMVAPVHGAMQQNGVMAGVGPVPNHIGPRPMAIMRPHMQVRHPYVLIETTRHDANKPAIIRAIALLSALAVVHEGAIPGKERLHRKAATMSTGSGSNTLSSTDFQLELQIE